MIRIALFLAAAVPLAAANYTLQGQFHSTANDRAGLVWENAGHASRPHFDSFQQDVRATGVFRSGPFIAPHDLRFFEAGFPTADGIRIYLENTDTHAMLDLRSRSNPALIWRERVYKIPRAWRGVRVSFVAEDRSTAENGWIGVTLPEPGRDSLLHSLLRAGLRSVFLVLDAMIFLLPGASFALLAFRRQSALSGFRAIALVVTGSGIVAYAVFGCYLIGPAPGRAAAILVITGSAIGLFWQLRSGAAWIPRAAARETALCFLTVTLTAIFYAGAGFLYYSDDEPTDLARARFFDYNLPTDNILPHLLAARLYTGKFNPNVRMGEWHSSDRPPLQTAIVLLEFPFWRVLSPSLHSQLFSVWLQCTWVAGVWVFLRAAGLGTRTLMIVIGFCLFSGFCWTNSFFVWPKLLAAAFCLMCLAFFPIVRGDGSSWSMLDAALAGATAALSLLSHAGCVFTFAAFFLIVLVRRGFPAKRQLAAALGMLVILMLPWIAYQKFYDPPGDALLKLHLADTVNEQQSLVDSLRAAYGHLTLRSFVESKAANVEALFWHPGGIRAPNPLAKALDWFLSLTFFALTATLGICNAGYLARLFANRGTATRLADLSIGTALLSVAVWCLAMFKGGSTWVHQGSYAQVLLLFAGLSIYLSDSWPRGAYILLAIQALVIFPVFIFAKPFVEALPNAIWDAPLDPGMLLITLSALAALLFTPSLLPDLD